MLAGRHLRKLRALKSETILSTNARLRLQNIEASDLLAKPSEMPASTQQCKRCAPI
jgi:hypothetical protein